jgi:hypothetical protein
MQTKQVVDQIESLLKELDRARAASPHDDLSGGLPDDELMKIKIRFMACIERLAPKGSAYSESAKILKGWNGYMVVELGGILGALKSDFEAGYIQTIEELVHGIVFDDFLEMASELLKKGYKDPAAVVAGSVLEEHIRKLAIRNNMTVLESTGKNKKFDTLTIELVKIQQISEPQRKIIAGWYGQRSEAAHGNYSNVVENEVSRMIEGIRDFMVRFPA